jgi:hypothetical protein
MDQSFPPLSLGGMPREIRDIITGYVVKAEEVIYHRVKIAEKEVVSFKSFTIRGYGCVCSQFREEYADTLNKHTQHLTHVGDINGDKLFDPNRYNRGFRSKIALVRKNNSPLWQCHPVLPSLSHLQLPSSFTRIVFEAFQGHYAMSHDMEQKVSVSFEFPLSKQGRKSVRHQEAAIYDHMFSAARLETVMQAYTTDINDITQTDNKRFKNSLKARIAIHDMSGRRRQISHTFLTAFRAFCDTMDMMINKAKWPAACCRHQNCSCFAKQIRTYITSTIVRCRGYPNTLYAFDSYAKRDDPTYLDLNHLRLAKHHRNQIRGSWVTGCNHNFEIFAEAASCHMDCEERGLPRAVAVSPTWDHGSPATQS